MKLQLSMLCVETDCEEIFEAAGACRCPSCGSGVVLPLARALDREVRAPARPSNVVDFPLPRARGPFVFGAQELRDWEEGLATRCAG